MKRLAVIGVETEVGAALLVHFDGAASVTGFRLDEVSAFADVCDELDDVIVCGDASFSTWECSERDGIRDRRFLSHYCRLTSQAGARLVYLSGDTVFDGPWMFHDDDAKPIATGRRSSEIQSCEQLVLKQKSAIVVRTHVITEGLRSVPVLLHDAVKSRRELRLSANNFATPLTSERLSILLGHVLQSDTSGVIHLAGAERVSPWKLAMHLARQHNQTDASLIPVLSSRTIERSLRCTRARHEFGLCMPSLSETLESLQQTTTHHARRAA